MKTTFAICLLALLSLPCFAQWTPLNTGFNISFFHDVHCISNSEIIVVGSEGTILKSSDGGDSWEQKDSGTDGGLFQVEFATSEIGYIAGGSGIVLKTMDGGETWETIIAGTNNPFYRSGLSCVNEDLVVINSATGMIKSMDSGESWISITDPPRSREIQFVSEEIGFAGGFVWEDWDWKNPQFYKTMDGGDTWQALSGTSPFHFLNENVGFHYLGGLKKTIDGGNSFENLTYHPHNDEFSFCDLHVVNENTIWGIIYLALLDGDTSSRGIVKISSNDTETFTEVTLPDNNRELDLFSIHFADENLGFAVGRENNKGIIWRNGNGTNEMMGTSESELSAFKIYPNPSKGEINISVKDLKGNFEVVISDMTGKKVYSEAFINQEQIKINTTSFTKGIYVVSIVKDKQARSQKVVVK